MSEDGYQCLVSVSRNSNAVIGKVRFLCTSIARIKDVPAALGSVRSDLEAIEPLLHKVLTGLEGTGMLYFLMDKIEGAVKSCNLACSEFRESLDHWMRHAANHEAFRPGQNDQTKVGASEQAAIDVFKTRLNDCKSTLVVALSTSSMLADFSRNYPKEVSMPPHFVYDRESLLREQAIATRKLARVEKHLKPLLIALPEEVSEHSKDTLHRVLEDLKWEKNINEDSLDVCKEELERLKAKYDEIEQNIKNTEAGDQGRAVVGLVNTHGEITNVNQTISDTSAKGAAIAGAGIIHGVDLSRPVSKEK